MSTARAFFRLAILPFLLLAIAAQTLDPRMYRERVPPAPAAAGCDPQRIKAATDYRLVPYFIGCEYRAAADLARHAELRLLPDGRPDQRPRYTIIDQNPRRGSPISDNRTIRVVVSTGPAETRPPVATAPPPPVEVPPRLPPKTAPGPVSGILVSNAAAIAGRPLQFRISMSPQGAAGRVHYEAGGGNAVPGVDYEPKRGSLMLEPSGWAIVSINTRQRAGAPDPASVLLVVTDGERILGRGMGRIRQLAPPPIIREPTPPVLPPPQAPKPPFTPAAAPPVQPPGHILIPPGTDIIVKPPCPDGRQPPCPVGPVDLSNATAIAGSPLQFTATVRAGGVGGEVSYSPVGGSAQPGTDYAGASGTLTLVPAKPSQIIVDTKPNPNSSGDLTMLMVLREGERIVARAIGTIRQPSPVAVGPVRLDVANAVAPNPVRFTLSLEPGGQGGKVSLSTYGRTAHPVTDYDEVHRDVTLDPAAGPVVIDVPTRTDANATGPLLVDLAVTDGDRELARQTGSISQPPPQPPTRTQPCWNGSVVPVTSTCPPKPWWKKLLEALAVVPPWVWGIAGILVGGILVYLVRRPPIHTGNGTSTPAPKEVPSPGPSFELTTAYPKVRTPPSIDSSNMGPKSPIVSLVVNCSRSAARVTSSIPSTEGQDA